MMLGLGCNMKILMLVELTYLCVINEWHVTVTSFVLSVHIVESEYFVDNFVLICREKVPVTLIEKSEKKNWYIIVPIMHMGR